MRVRHLPDAGRDCDDDTLLVLLLQIPRIGDSASRFDLGAWLAARNDDTVAVLEHALRETPDTS